MGKLAEIKARANAATAGPWEIYPYDRTDKCIEIQQVPVRVDYDDVDHDEQDANAAFIAHAREDVPALLNLIARLRAFVDGRSYQPHESDCLSTGELPDTCDCGFDALLEETKE